MTPPFDTFYLIIQYTSHRHPIPFTPQNNTFYHLIYCPLKPKKRAYKSNTLTHKQLHLSQNPYKIPNIFPQFSAEMLKSSCHTTQKQYHTSFIVIIASAKKSLKIVRYSRKNE